MEGEGVLSTKVHTQRRRLHSSRRGAALGRVAMHAKRVRAGKAALSSPTQSCVDSPARQA
jgi:hypothetical protein